MKIYGYPNYLTLAPHTEKGGYCRAAAKSKSRIAQSEPTIIGPENDLTLRDISIPFGPIPGDSIVPTGHYGGRFRDRARNVYQPI